MKRISIAVQPAPPVATRTTGSSPDASSLSAPPELQKFAETLEKVCVDTVESGHMTKDLAVLVGPDQKWLTTTKFLDKLNDNLKKAMAA